MNGNATGADQRLIEEHADLLDALLDIEQGWATTPELVYNIAPHDPAERSRARRLLGALGRRGALATMTVRHQGDGLAIYKIDHDAIERVLDEVG